MGVKIKVTKRISPKNKDKIKREISTVVSARTEDDKIIYMGRNKSVKNNKKHK